MDPNVRNVAETAILSGKFYLASTNDLHIGAGAPDILGGDHGRPAVSNTA